MSATTRPPTERVAFRALAWADALANRLYGWRANPLYQSGTIVIALLLVILVTGLWLILFYRVGAPWASVERITADRWVGNWMRGMHRYASDAAVLATIVHAFRMYAQGRSWGPRALAWVTGVGLLVLLMLCGWTGYVMVWDTFGQTLAREGARMLDALPVLSEPTSRAFTGERPLPPAFFFLNLFAHIGIPLALGIGLWLHISRVARPALLPPKPLGYGVVGALLAISLAIPITMLPEASPFTIPATVPVDLFFGFWIPFARRMSGGGALLAAAGAVALLAAVPLLTRRRGDRAAPPSTVDEEICVGCEQCAADCPYDAITMITRAPGGRSELVARVDPARCVSCGICAGSCAPMGVGPPGRTGRDQLAEVRAFIESPERRAGEHVVVACDRGASRWGDAIRGEGAALLPVDCAGNLHTSVVELLVRNGSAGVLVVACPPRDCWNREGPRWLLERMYHDREAELQARVDRSRVRVAYANAAEGADAVAALRDFVADTRPLGAVAADPGEVGAECDVELTGPRE
ncbi:MAG: hydrogenase iron-sulfur subunit [Gemmatimonadetes bacterium]|nr:hydrogenase iron-sulfur subunit [Gemmatimonadota bacterium]